MNFLEGEGVAGGGVGGEHEAYAGFAAAQFIHEGEGDAQLADADGLNPDGLSRGVKQLGFRAAVTAEALREVAGIASATQHAHQVMRKQKEKHDGENEIVYPPNHG